MESPFSISDENLRILLDSYSAWLAEDGNKQKEYAQEQREHISNLRKTLLNNDYLSNLSDERLADEIFRYSRKLEGPAFIRLGNDRIKGEITSIRRNLSYLIEGPDDPFEKAEKILEGEYKIQIFAKAFWSPILQAQYPEILPNWNNKTERFLEKVGINLSTTKLSGKERYKLLSRAFLYLKELDAEQDFYTLNYLMHYGTEIKEGADLLDELLEPSDSRCWQIAPGEKARLWDDLRTNSIAAVGYSNFDLDLSGKSKEELLELSREYYPDYTEHQRKADVTQLWHFLNLKPGDKFVTNKGRGLLLGLGIVKGAYRFRRERKEYKHTVNVEYYKVNDSGIPIPENLKGKFGRTIVPLTKGEFETLERVFGGEKILSEGSPLGGAHDCPFSIRTFELLSELHENPTRAFYQNHGKEFKEHVEEPFQQLFRQVRLLLPPSVTDAMETEKGIFARILKNDFGKGGAWDYYWGAFYPKGGQRIKDAQLFLMMSRDRLEFGFYIGDYGPEQQNRFLRNCQKNREALVNVLSDSLVDDELRFGKHQEFVGGENDSNIIGSKLTWEEWLKNPEEAGIHVCVLLEKNKVLQSSTEQLKTLIAKSFGQLFPLVLLATSENPLRLISNYLELIDEGSEPNPLYPLTQFAQETGFEEEMLLQWVRAIERKGQVIVYGPPGTGKTYVAEKFARHLIGGHDGFYELVQFHPAYAYEDFMQGIRPEPRDDGSLFYPLVPGRFLDFCSKARSRKGRCVLIIDEINRANLARVFGELMYLLEYRDRAVPLAGGSEFRIPANVRVIGTMNTADRSIALVDHALRRRFAFLALYPNYDVLRKFHRDSGFPVERLINILSELNKKIGDRHYEVGITFFLRRDVGQQLEDIWKMEIEPYLEEYFFDQRDTAKEFYWDKVKDKVLS